MRPQLLIATRILERTMPVMTRRLLVYGAITFSILSSTVIGAGTAYGLASFSDNPGWWGQIGAVAGLALSIYLYRLLRPILYYHIDLLHLMAIVYRIIDRELPSGKEQVTCLYQQVQGLFSFPKAAFDYHRKLQQVITEAFASLPPGNRLSRLPMAATLQKWLAFFLLGLAADAIMAPALIEKRLDAIRLGAGVFCRHYGEIFRQSLILNAFLYTLLLAAFWLLLKPVGWVDDALPTPLGVWQYVFAAILTYWIKTAFLDPIVSAAMTLSFLPLCENMEEDEMTEWTSQVSSLAQFPKE